jgi:hypothetical protein
MWPVYLYKLSYFDAIGDPCNPNANTNPFFGFPHWWQYINNGERDGFGNCIPKPKIPEGLWAIALAVVDMLLYLAGIVAVVALIISGIMLITSAGNSEKATAARRRIINALVGLAIVLIASLVVGFIGNSIG